MSFIGIIADEKNENYIEKSLLKYLENNEHTILFIDSENIDNIKNVKFQTILIIDEIKRQIDDIQMLKSILENTKQVIMNADIEDNLEVLENLNISVITYGFNLKSTIIASSVTEEEMLICIQRKIKTIKDKMIDPQEVIIDLIEKEFTNGVYPTMGIIILLILYNRIQTE